MPAWLKAGLIGGAILFFLDLLGQISILGCCTFTLILITYISVGVMTGAFMTPPRETGKAAGQGALAAVVAAAIGGVINLIISMFRALLWSTSQVGQVWTDLPYEMRYLLRDMGLEPEMVNEFTSFMGGIGGTTICGSVCCMAGIFVAAILGALGAISYAAAKSD